MFGNNSDDTLRMSVSLGIFMSILFFFLTLGAFVCAILAMYCIVFRKNVFPRNYNEAFPKILYFSTGMTLATTASSMWFMSLFNEYLVGKGAIARDCITSGFILLVQMIAMLSARHMVEKKFEDLPEESIQQRTLTLMLFFAALGWITISVLQRLPSLGLFTSGNVFQIVEFLEFLCLSMLLAVYVFLGRQSMEASEEFLRVLATKAIKLATFGKLNIEHSIPRA